MKVDLLAFGAHPDDIEMSCSGIILSFTENGKKAAIVDFTQGELGTRGTPDIRKKEASKAEDILGLSQRHNLDIKDVFFEENHDNIRLLVEQIRRFQPDIILANAPDDRHPDHGKAARMVERAHFYAGLVNYETTWEGKKQDRWKAKNLYHYMQDRELQPSVIVDITPYWNKRMESIKAYKSQFYNPGSKEKHETYLSSEKFWKFFEARARDLGHRIGVEYAEGLIQKRDIGVSNISHLI